MNQEGMDDRAYFSDWGGCICPEDGFDDDCPYWDGDEQRHFEEEEDE